MPTATGRSPSADAFGVCVGAAVLTAVVALPVLLSPSTRIFGAEIVGRHHDPFTVMRQFTQAIRLDAYSQPFTDVPGVLLAQVVGPVAAYNWLVLFTFPLAALTAFLLARHVDLSRTASVFAALVFAFSPFHVAQAAYHPHITQVQWVPLYLFALWRCLDRWTWSAVAVLALATMGVTLSNFYGGMIAAVVTPVAGAVYWFLRVRGTPHASRSLIATVSTLTALVVGGLAYVWVVAPGVLRNPAAVAFARADLFAYSAKWWGYLVPPVNNPWLGDVAHRVWASADVREGLLEQQVSLGVGVVLLGVVAIACWVARRRLVRTVWAVPVLVVVALTALVCSLSPERVIDGVTVVRPSAWLYAVAPMFRSYARFGVVVQLMAALLAGLGLDVLRRGPRMAKLAAAILAVLVAAEYAVVPSALSRDVLPTPAHRWVVDQGVEARALDCVRLTPESSSLPWLTDQQIVVLGGQVSDCSEPHLADKLAGLGITHVIIRAGTSASRWFKAQPLPAGLRRVSMDDGVELFEVVASRPVIYTAEMIGFAPREFDAAWTWRWMEGVASWGVVNTTAASVRATLQVELQAFHEPRHLEVFLDGQLQQVILVEPERQSYEMSPLTLTPGGHSIAFRTVEPPTVADAVMHNGDTRALSVSFGVWAWGVVSPSMD